MKESELGSKQSDLEVAPELLGTLPEEVALDGVRAHAASGQLGGFTERELEIWGPDGMQRRRQRRAPLPSRTPDRGSRSTPQ